MPFKSVAKFGKKKKPLSQKAKEKIVLDNIMARKSIRRYSSRSVTEKEINTIILAATSAPSAGNQQPWEFVIVKDYERRKLVAETCFDEDKWISEAPVLIVACINMKSARSMYGERGEKLYVIQDVAAACQNMLLAATAMGLGSCWIGSFSEPKLAILLEVPDHIRPSVIVAVGWPEEDPEKPKRLPLVDVMKNEKYEVLPTRWQEGVYGR